SESSDPIWIFINSPGGDVDAGFAIYDMARFVSCPVYMVGMGLVASAAALILLAVPAERRIGLPNSSYLIHQPLSEMRGNATEIEIHAMQMEKMKAKLNSIIAEATGKSLEVVSQDTDRDHWLDAEEAKAYGLISKVVKSREAL
ncbi:MAG: ATP-dependent Clp protease proteolytic subunit, partial [Spirochaetales bacterium]|nr:ATP-dependent Clp protease proteolytic subunit [Spirochaetales bacterium]